MIVVADYRGNGFAKLLMSEQHKILKERGYSSVRTATQNRFREMLILNIKSGFAITGVEKKSSENEIRILMEKVL